jgi:hypothetical protein
MHIQGLELRTNISDDASYVGKNSSSLAPPGSSSVPPGNSLTYHYYAREEGTFFLYAMDDTNEGQLQAGLFGSVNVEPPGAEYYRSQVTQAELQLATTGATTDGHPIINYAATYPSGQYAGNPILNMLVPVAGSPNTYNLLYTDLTAIITGPNHGVFTSQSPSFNAIPSSPDRRQPYREFSIHYHSPKSINNAFPNFISSTTTPLSYVTNNTGGDNFGINYGISGIASEVFANRLGLGPVQGCAECKFEEFFLSSWPLGDPAMLVDHPTCPDQTCNTNTTPATTVFYPDDPSNVYHSYLSDHVKFHIHNAAQQAHVHHQHAHQWLHTPNSDNSLYLDSQLIVPGSSYTLEIAHGGSGNRNLTAGDSIFHCHFYPHFAQGMWALWRVHDTFESGTLLTNGIPASGARALPDGEIVAGTPIPAIVPLPTLGMAPLPATVQLVDNGTRVNVTPFQPPQGPPMNNPGYPFFVPGLAGHRAPHPPMDFARQGRQELNGGLPRHLVVSGTVVNNSFTQWDFSKDFVFYNSSNQPVAGGLTAFQLPEQGTQAEQAAMTQHSGKPIPAFRPDGTSGVFFQENGLPAVQGAPFANPDVGLNLETQRHPRRYKAAVIQTDAVLNKVGWHYPQERLITLWNDVQPTLTGQRPPEPFFFRSQSGESIEFWHTNLVPNYYQVDDFQVRTPTDIIGQHIHLVKFDVLASDGAANGFNYEDGTLSPDDVRERIDAINLNGGLYPFDNQTQWSSATGQKKLKALPPPKEVGTAPAGQNWLGAQTTIQRWSSDPLLNNAGVDRTLRSVFTHDHFGPSTHQQAGLYAALLVEPSCSQWSDSTTGKPMPDPSRGDGGPTSWQAIIAMPATYNCTPSSGLPLGYAYREFALEFQDLALAYTNQSPSTPSNALFQSVPLFTTAGTYGPFTNAKNQTVPSGLATELCNNGINISSSTSISTCSTLTTQATINPNPPSGPAAPSTWYIWAPIPANSGSAPAGYHVYTLVPTSISTTNASALQVLTPGIQPGWVDTLNAINPSNGASDWTASNAYTQGQTIQPSTTNKNAGGFSFAAITSGTSGAAVPTNGFPQNLGGTVTDGTAPTAITWQNIGILPQPTLVSATTNAINPGVYSVNYRNEPLPLRVAPASTGTSLPNSTDLSYAYSSNVARNNSVLNSQPTPQCPITTPNCTPPVSGSGFTFPATLTPGMTGGDPFTPLLRAYENDKVQVRVLTGAHVQPHGLTIHGVNWQFEPTDPTSGYRGSQGMGISEHFEMLFQLPKSTTTAAQPFADYLYAPSSGTTGQTSGTWGLMRAYSGTSGTSGAKMPLQTLPNNPTGGGPPGAASVCPPGSTPTPFTVVAMTAQQAIAPLSPATTGALVYNSRTSNGATAVTDPNALIFLRAQDVPPAGTTIPFNQVEPLVLRAHAGDCIQITLQNQFTANSSSLTQTATAGAPFGIGVPGGGTSVPSGYGLPVTNLNTSSNVGLHAGLVSLDVSAGDGVNVGMNPVQTAAPNGQQTWSWYAGNRTTDATGNVTYTPMEFGSIGLTSSDPLLQPTKGLVGALVIEPQGATVTEDSNTHAAATVSYPGGSFREFVVVMQDSVENSAGTGAINYRSEPSSSRLAPSGNNKAFLAAVNKLAKLRQGTVHSLKAIPPPDTDPSALFSNYLVGGDPQTPVFQGQVGLPVRFRVVYTGGDTAQVLNVHGHVWQERPYLNVNGSQQIGDNSQLSQWLGSQQMDPNENADFVIANAGGSQGVLGDYLYNTILQSGGQGTWGLMRVSPKVVGSSATGIKGSSFDGKFFTVSGSSSAKNVTFTAVTRDQVTDLGSVPVGADGDWTFQVESSKIPPGATVHVAADNGAAEAPASQSNGDVEPRQRD